MQQVIVVDDNNFCWVLSFPFLFHKTCEKEKYPAPAPFRSCQNPHHSLKINPDSVKARTMFSFTVTKDDTRAHCRLIGMKFIGKKWSDKELS